MSAEATFSNFKSVLHNFKVKVKAYFGHNELHKSLFDLFLLLLVKLVELSSSLSGISSKFLVACGKNHLVEVRVA